jgi:hypothetical protein
MKSFVAIVFLFVTTAKAADFIAANTNIINYT